MTHLEYDELRDGLREGTDVMDLEEEIDGSLTFTVTLGPIAAEHLRDCDLDTEDGILDTLLDALVDL